MASAPLNWLLKIGGETLKTTAKTLSEAVNTLHDSVTSLSTTVTNLGTTVTNLGTSKADASTTTTALNNLETSKLNVSDLLSLEEIEASTSLTGKGVTAESVKSLNNSIQELLKSSVGVGDSITMISTVSVGTNTYTPVVRIRILLKQVTVIDATATGSYQTSSSEVIKTYTDTDNNIKIKVRFTAVFGNTVPNYTYISINDGSEQKFNVGNFSYGMSPSTKNFAGYIIKVDNKYSTSLAEIN